MSLIEISRRLSKRVDQLRFARPVTHVYNPLAYARAPHEQYLERFGRGKKRVVFLGMNPGPFGMAQTGVPFGEVGMVRDWLGISGPVKRPPASHPKRPIEGFACARSEVSGARLWGLFRDVYPTPDDFFEAHFVANYCPLAFMEESGKNRTPDKLPEPERALLYAACDAALVELVRVLEPELLVGVGAFAADRADRALDGAPVRIASVLHPSPASPKANRGWAAAARAELAELGVQLGK
ncbi:MAG: single-stranded DNA-binding protein [Polyangiaceae bacterium]|nr:single-stranded DNA-binding protein [Polyangiaceae bacterium]